VDLPHGVARTIVVVEFDLGLDLHAFFDDIDGQPEDAGEELRGEA
jgi:hypothetical protein